MEFHQRLVPYTFRPPRQSAWLGPVVAWLSDQWYLRRKFAIAAIEVAGADLVGEAVADGAAVMLAGNHADHADPYVLWRCARDRGWDLRFLAAREGFELGKAASLALQHAGAFSIDRDGPDLAALKMAIETVASCQHPLVIFPEGEIYHHQESLDPLHDGFASILLKAMAKTPPGRRTLLIPTALRYCHPREIEKTWGERIARLEAHVFGRTYPAADPADRLLAVGTGVLAGEETHYLGAPRPDLPLPDRLAGLRDAIFAQVEARIGASHADKPAPDRFRHLRGTIRRRLLAKDNAPAGTERASLVTELTHLHKTIQLYSYPGTYLTLAPNRDRITETILKLEEDILGAPRYPVARTARVSFGRPIDAALVLDAHGGQAKPAARALTQALTESLTHQLATQ